MVIIIITVMFIVNISTIISSSQAALVSLKQKHITYFVTQKHKGWMYIVKHENLHDKSFASNVNGREINEWVSDLLSSHMISSESHGSCDWCEIKTQQKKHEKKSMPFPSFCVHSLQHCIIRPQCRDAKPQSLSTLKHWIIVSISLSV